MTADPAPSNSTTRGASDGSWSLPKWSPQLSWTDVVFWGLLGVALFALLRPLWLGPTIPAWDFGGHVALADAWTRLDAVEVYRQVYERRTGILPNTVAARFASLLHPAVDTLTAMRIFVTICLVATALSLYATLRTFRRSRWLLFGCLPLLWNGSVYWGMVNYVAAFPFFFAAIALARRTGQTADWRWGVPLGLIALASFFVHGLGCPLTVASATLVLLCSIRRTWSLAWLGVFAPPTAVWWYWRQNVEGSGVPEGGIVEILENAQYFGPYTTGRRLGEQALDMTVSSQADVWMLWGLVGIWLVWMGVSRGTARVAEGYDGREEGKGRLRAWGERLHRQVDRHALLILTVFLFVLFLVAPGFIGTTNVKSRIAPLFLWTAMMLPRLPRRDVLAGVATVAAIGLSCAVGLYVEHHVRKIHALEFEPMVEVIDRIPDGSRVECMNVSHGGNGPVFRAQPLEHNCVGLVHVRASSFARFGFPKSAYNVVTYRDSASHPNVRHGDYSQIGGFQSYDYLVVREGMRRPPESLAEEVAVAGGKKTDYGRSTRWRLYEIRTREVDAAKRLQVGGEGGSAFEWPCGDGKALAGLEGELTSSDTLGEVRALCRPVRHAESGADAPEEGGADSDETDDGSAKTDGDRSAALVLRGAIEEGRRIGSWGSGRSFRATCPSDEFLVGLEGRAGKFVDRVEILCAPVQRSKEGAYEWTSEAVENAGGAGSDGGSPYRVTCSSDTVASGLVGRNGGKIDAVGIACAKIERFTKGRD